jgi:hypothetical protein
VSPRTGLDDVEKRKILPLPGLELRPIGRPVCSQPLYRLRYLVFCLQHINLQIWLMEEIPKNWRKSMISLPYKGDLTEYHNYRRVSLVNTASKALQIF